MRVLFFGEITSKGRVQPDTHIHKDRMGMKPNIWWTVLKSQSYHHERCMHEVLQWKESLYLGTDVSGIGLGAGLLQIREGMKCPYSDTPDNTTLHPMAFASTILYRVKTRFNFEEVLGILHGLEKFHQCCFTHVNIITDHKPMIAIFKRM